MPPARNRVAVIVSFCLLWMITRTLVHACNGTVTLWPTQKIAVEGTSVTFWCQCQSGFLVCDWVVNGTRPVGITRDTEDINGSPAFKFIILALPEYNSTTIECLGTYYDQTCHSPQAELLVTGALTNVSLLSTMNEIVLTWNVHEVYPVCVTVSSAPNKSILSDRQCLNHSSSYFTLSVENPDPTQPYTFAITPTLSNGDDGITVYETGYFLGVPSLPTNSVRVDVVILIDRQVSLVVRVDNQSVTNGRRVDNFTIEVYTDGTVCSDTVPLSSLEVANTTVTFYPSCPDLPINSHLSANVTASNAVGNISQTTPPFSTFLLQPIEVHLCTPGPSVCQLVVEFQSVFNGVVTALVLLYDGQDSIHAFVGSLSVAGAQGNVIVDGLERGSYYVSVFALDILELTSMYYPANGPTKSSIPPPSSVDQRTKHLEKVSVQSNEKDTCFECTFVSDSPATHCDIVLFSTKAKHVRLQRKPGVDKARGYYKVDETGLVSVIAFASVNETVTGLPFIIKSQYIGLVKHKQSLAWIAVAILVILVVVSVAVAWAVVRRCCGSSTNNDDSSVSGGDGGEVGSHDLPHQTSTREVHELGAVKNPNGQDNSDSGRFTQTTSTTSASDEVPANHEGEEATPLFQKGQHVQGGDDRSNLVTNMEEGTDPEVRKERCFHGQEETSDSGLGYKEAIFPTLQSQSYPVGSSVHVHDEVDIVDAAGDLNTSGLPFLHVFEQESK